MRILRATCSGSGARSPRCRPLGGGGGAARGDFNADGFADLAIGVPREDVEGVDDAGAVNVIYGSANGLVASAFGVPENQFWHQDVAGVLGTAARGDRFGSAVVAGDFDLNGFSDLAIGVPFKDERGVTDAGAVNVLYGSRAGLTATDNQRFTHFDFRDESPAGGRFGASLVAGDFGLGLASDLAIGAPFYDVVGRDEAGQVFLLFGSTSRLVATGKRSITQTSLGNFTIGGTEAGDHFGRATGAANLGKGPEADLVIGVPEEDGVGGGENMGAAHVVFGGSNGPALIGSQLLLQPGAQRADNRFGSAFAAGDFDADGFNDLAVGMPTNDAGGDDNSGAVDVIYGTSTGPNPNRFQFWTQTNTRQAGTEGDDRFGAALAASNFGRTGHADLAVGSPGEDIDTAGFDTSAGEDNDDSGAVFVIYGATGGLSATSSNPAQVFHQQENLPKNQAQQDLATGDTDASNLGSALTAWNFGRSIQADLAIGTPGNMFDFGSFSREFRSGAAFALYGSSTGLTTSGVQLWDQDVRDVRDNNEDGDRFGEAVY